MCRRAAAQLRTLDMSWQFSVADHAIFFNGYLDAVGRHYSDDKRLCALSAALAPSDFLQQLSISSRAPVSDMTRDFDREVSALLATDSSVRLIFYLVEYFEWFREFSSS